MENLGDPRPAIATGSSRETGPARIYGTGEMAEQIRAYPWETSLLGSTDQWSPTLVAIVNVVISSPIPAAVYWGPHLIFLCNDASLHIMGAKAADVLGLPAAVLWGAHWPQVADRCRAIMDSGKSFHVESVPFSFRRDTKSEAMFVNYSLSPIYQDGQVAGIFRTLEETTDTVLAMRALAESDARLRMALSVGNCVGVWDWHIQKNIVYGDETIAGFYGIDPKAAAAGTSNLLYERMLHPDDIVVLADAILACITTGKDLCVDYRVRRPDSSYRWIQTRGRCVYDENGHACRVTGVKLDITAQKAKELSAALPRNLFPHSETDSIPASITTFVAATANVLAEFPSEIELQLVPEAAGTRIVLRVTQRDMGKIIGKQGRIIRAIRTILYAAAAACSRPFSIDVTAKTERSDRPDRS